MKLSERESVVLESLWMSKKLGFESVKTKTIATARGLNMSQANATIYQLRGRGLATQHGIGKYSITRAGIKEADKQAVRKVIEMARDDLKGCIDD